MENRGKQVSVENITAEIAELIKNDIVVLVEQKKNSIELRFLEGQKFYVYVAEIL